MMRPRRLAAAIAIAAIAAGCTGADQAQPAGSGTAGTTGRTGTTKPTRSTTMWPTYPPISGPDMVGTASTVESTDAELKIAELNDAPTRIDLPCRIEHQTDGYTEALSRIIAQPPAPTVIKAGTPLTYQGKPVNFKGTNATLDENWIRMDIQNELILADVDPVSAQVRGDTYRITGCQYKNISRSPTGETWIALCHQENTPHSSHDSGTAVRLDPAGVSFNSVIGLPNSCPRVVATDRYTWLIPSADHGTRSKRIRLWRLDPTTGDWLTVDFPENIGDAVTMAYTGGVLWQRSNDNSYCIAQDPPASHGPTGVTFEHLNQGGGFGGFRGGQMWTAAEHHRLVAFDCDGNKTADFALNDPASVTVGEPGIIAQRPSRRDRPEQIPLDANIIVSRIDPTTGQATDLLTAPAPNSSTTTGEPVGGIFGIILDRTGGWFGSGGTRTRIPDSWFTPG